MLSKRRRIYLDYAATTPVAPEVERAMRLYFGKIFGNPGSVHWFGQEASAAVFQARQTIARALGGDYEEIIFTGSATEANNLALRGGVGRWGWSARYGCGLGLGSKNKNINSLTPTPHHTAISNPNQSPPPKIIISAIEHESVLETARDLEKQGVEVVYLPVDKNGFVDLKKLKAALDENTVLVSIQYANSEIGVVQPIKEIVSIVKDSAGGGSNVLVHTDAVQAFQFLPCRVDELGVDMMTLSAHKIYGPKGIGVLYVRNPKSQILNPIITGGGQEQGLRSGTENAAGIIGFAKAVEINQDLKIATFKNLKKLRDYLWRGIKKIVPGARLNGPDIKSDNRLVNNLNVYFPGRPAQDLTIELDLWGVSVSPGTACSARSANPSYVIEALGDGGDRPKSSLRLTLGRPTTLSEIKQVLTIFKKRFYN